MYSEKNRRASVHRSDDEFLRRMLGGALTAGGKSSAESAVPGGERPVLPENDPGRVPCNGGNGNAPVANGRIPMPSLAMVYSPVQAWENLLEPADGLCRGSIFADLILPLEAVPSAGEEAGRRSPCGGK